MEFTTQKYAIGDKVWKAERQYKDKSIACPDCLGTKKWTVVFADGEALEIDCQTCKNGYMPPCGQITYKEWDAGVIYLTIGKIYDWSPEDGMRYMCEETGVGSGTIHCEKDLFVNKDDAMARAKEDHIEGMKHLAQNNFSKKFKGKQAIENMLSTFGFSRRSKFEKMRQFVQWAKISGIIKEAE